MISKVVIHNSVSLDGSLTDFDVNLPLHYQIAGSFNADMHLVGSNTAKIGIEMFLEKIPEETDADFKKPEKQGQLWAIPDTSGKLKGLLHVFRQSEYCQDVVILASQKTPEEYIQYLKERNYNYHVVGEDKCNLRQALELLNEEYKIKTILADSGAILSNLLIDQGLVSEISILIHPIIVGNKSYNMFSHIRDQLKFNLIKQELLNEEFVWLVFSKTEKT